MQIDPFSSPCTKFKSKWIKDLHIKQDTLDLHIKPDILIEEKVGKRERTNISKPIKKKIHSKNGALHIIESDASLKPISWSTRSFLPTLTT